MTNFRRKGCTAGITTGTILAPVTLLASQMLIAVILVCAPVANSIASGTLSQADQQCMACHSMKGLSKSLDDGESLSLHVPGEEFAASVHAAFGCAACHADVSMSSHPAPKPIAGAREYAVSKSQACGNCHAGKAQLYEGSIHASLVKDGNLAAPVCTDCHSAHSVKPMDVYEPITGISCKNCHEDIFEAYAGSVHGLARAETDEGAGAEQKAHMQAPICSNCHQAHEVKAVASGDRLKSACLGCHEGATLAHRQWLPNSEMHLESVACPACHSPMAERRIDLELYDNVAQAPLAEQQGQAQFQERAENIDTAGDGLDPMELWDLVRETSREGQMAEVTLRGRMEVRTGVEAHRLADKTLAVRNCDSCHRNGADPYENVTISISRPDGRKLRYEADKEILSSVISVDSIEGFYTVGGTRIKLLDGLLILSLIGGLAIPIGHITLGKIYKKKH